MAPGQGSLGAGSLTVEPSFLMFGRATAILKAVLGIGMLVVGAFLAAQKLDRERGQEMARDAAYSRDLDAVGSIAPRMKTPGGPTQGPAR